MSGIVAIVGRPNVGKSTLFNRLIERREAIVDATSGVTRDRHYGKCFWNGKEFSVIDTGGYVVGSDDIFEQEIDKQVNLAIDESDVVLFIVDVLDGIHPLDEDVIKLLRQSNKPFFTTVNKVDSSTQQVLASEFYRLGVETYFPISGMNGSGTGELLDAVVETLPYGTSEEEEKESFPRFAVVGRPNVGKSSFINQLIQDDRFIATDIPGTTRDSSDTFYNQFGFEFFLVDTAGIRKKSKVKENLEFYSVMRSIRTIEHSDVCLLLVDATRGFEGQDSSIFWLAQRNRKGIVILVNKWDLIEKDTQSTRLFEQQIHKEITPFSDVPIFFISVLEKQRVLKSLEKAIEVHKNRSRRIPTRKLNDVMLPIIERQPPPSYKGKYIKIKFCTQLPTPTPMFAFFCNLPQYLKSPYKRFLENNLREHFNFEGVPIEIFFRKK